MKLVIRALSVAFPIIRRQKNIKKGAVLEGLDFMQIAPVRLEVEGDWFVPMHHIRLQPNPARRPQPWCWSPARGWNQVIGYSAQPAEQKPPHDAHTRVVVQRKLGPFGQQENAAGHVWPIINLLVANPPAHVCMTHAEALSGDPIQKILDALHELRL